MSAESYARAVLRFNRAGRRWPVALKAACTVAGPVLVCHLLGHTAWGLMMGLGAFVVLYAPQSPARFRIRLMGTAGVLLVLAATLGGMSALIHPGLQVVVMTLLAAVSATVFVALKVGPPGSFFVVLVAGISGSLVTRHVPCGELVGFVALGALVGIVVGMSDLVDDPARPERVAVEVAQEAVEAFEQADDTDLVAIRGGTSQALHQAWTAFRDSAGDRPLSPRALEIFNQIGILQTRYTRRSAELAGRALDADPVEAQPWGSPEGDELAPAVLHSGWEEEQLRESSLGRPDAGYLLRQGLRWPSEVLLVGLRVGLASAIAGGISLFVGGDHTYWVVAFTVLVLHQGGSRRAQTVRGLQRLIGTLGGLAVYALLVWSHPQGVWLALVVFCLQFVVEMVVVRNYALATVFITPLALTIASIADDRHPWRTMIERGQDTAIAIAVALAVLWLVGRRTPLLFARAHARRCILATEQVMGDLAESRYATTIARRNRSHLYYELLELEQILAQALSDAPNRLRPYAAMFEAVATLGYLVLGACWHPQVRRAREAFGRAVEPLQEIKAHPVSQPRSAADIHADVLAVQQVITDWR